MKKIISTAMLAFVIIFGSCQKTETSPKQKYSLDEDTSVAEWTGYGQGIQHDGSFAVTGQDLEVVNGRLKSGSFRIPISSIKNFNLPPEVKDLLLNHLKSPDFFNMALHPEARFTISRVTPLQPGAANAIEGANHLVTGDFTLLGKTNQISFPAKITVSGESFLAEAILKLDRTKWGMTYGADPALGEHYIAPDVDLHLKLSGRKQ